MYALGKKVLDDITLESIMSKFLRNEYEYLQQKKSIAEGHGDMAKV